MFWYIFFAAIGAVITLLLHETSHVVAVKLCGGKVVSFKPWPHKKDDISYFGRVEFSDVEERLKPAIWFSPIISSQLFALIFFYLSGFFFPFIVLALWELEDATYWYLGYLLKRKGSDGLKFREAVYGEDN
jgi:hypothetical protein